MLRNVFVVVLLFTATKLRVGLGAEIVGFFTIQPLEYHNPDGRDWYGDYCDSAWPFGASSACDHFFYLTISTSKSSANGAVSIGQVATQHEYYLNENDIVFKNQFGQYQNPLRFAVYSTQSWNGEFVLNLEVDDYDAYSSNDHVDTLSSLFTKVQPDNVYRQIQIFGSRSNFIFKYKFECQVNLYGNLCQTKCQTQSNSHYFCNNVGDKVCYEGWLDSTTNCNTPDPCYPYPCVNGGVCTRQATTYKCVCPAAYYGTNCQLNREPCSYKNICLNNATCYSVGMTALCSCTKYFQGPTCADDVDECIQDNRCSKESTCVNQIGNYTCNCPSGLTGRHCLDDVDECSTIPDYCAHDGRCKNYYGTVECLCSSQWQGARCNVDKNECMNWSQTDGSTACLNGGECFNFAGGYNCSCSLNYVGGRCENHKCLNIVCYNGGVCKISNTGVAVCNCLAGFSGNDCSTNINNCTPTSCLNGGLCTDLVNDFSCLCPIGYAGKSCKERTDDCVGITCLHKGVCQNLPTRIPNQDGFKCKCVQGYQGQFCQENIDDCINVSCLNNGICIDLVSDFHCMCKAGFDGRYCQNNTSNCKPDVCKNGKCLDLLNGFECKCQNGFSGGYCQVNINDCEYDSCLHDGVCKDGVDSFSCECRYGFNGSKCENLVANSDVIASPLMQIEDPKKNSNVALGVPIGVTLVIILMVVVAIAFWRGRLFRALRESTLIRHKSEASLSFDASMNNAAYDLSPDQCEVFDNFDVYEAMDHETTSIEAEPIQILRQNGLVNVIYDTSISPPSLPPRAIQEQSDYDIANNFSLESGIEREPTGISIQQPGLIESEQLNEKIYEELFSHYEQTANLDEVLGQETDT